MTKKDTWQSLNAKMLAEVDSARRRGLKVVLVTGVFDLLHQEHLNFLAKARAAGDFLLVGIESDARVKALKGEQRPIDSQERRLSNLTEQSMIDAVFILPDNFGSSGVREALIARLRPDVLAVSSHTPHLQSKKNIITKYGGRLAVVYEWRPALSTTRKIQAGLHFDHA